MLPDVTTIGLRERKKVATRAALADAALRIAVERGIDHVTPESVSEAVGVSPRTFRNYFGSVHDAIASGVLSRGEAFATALRKRPADESVWDSLIDLVPEHANRLMSGVGRLALRPASTADRALHAYLLVAMEDTERLLAQVIGERIGLDPQVGGAPALLASLAMLSVRVAVQAQSSSADPADDGFPVMVRKTLLELRAGVVGGELSPALSPAGSVADRGTVHQRTSPSSRSLSS